MRHLRTIILFILVSVSLASAKPFASLRQAETQDQASLYCSAVIKINNATDRIAGGVCIKLLAGGPVIIIPVSIAPRMSQELNIHLPAIASAEVYRIELLNMPSPAGEVIATCESPIHWLGDIASNTNIINPQAYEAFDADYPPRNTDLLDNIMIAAVLLTITLIATLLIRNPIYKLTILTVLILAASITTWQYLDKQPTLIIRQFPASDTSSYPLTVVTCRRTRTFNSNNSNLMPIYKHQFHMTNDKTVIIIGKSISCPISPQEILLFSDQYIQ